MKPVQEDSAAGLDRWCEALDWYTTLRAAHSLELTQALGRKWQEWHAIAENRRVFDAVSRLMSTSKLCRGSRRPGVAKRLEDRYDISLSIQEWRRAEAERTKSRRHHRFRAWWRLSGGIGLAAFVIVFLLWSFGFDTRHATPRATLYETGAGGGREVDLRDGSRLVLGQRTRLTVAYSARQRRVKLIEGQAWFNVKHDAQWPFVVSAGDGTITDAGTAFLVTRESDRVMVAVIDGKVEVSARPRAWPRFRRELEFASGPPLARVVVTSGEQLAIRDNGMLGHITHADFHAPGGCACGPLIFDNISLREVTAILNSHSSRKILVDRAAGALRLSGVVYSDEIPQWLESLQRSLPVTVDARGSSICIRMRRARPPAGPSLHGGRL